jgi:sec-independent protein translocase protein TatC
MSKYLLEIKNRLILLLLTWLSTISICYLYKETILFIIMQPKTFTNVNEHLAFFYFIFTDVTEILSTYLKLILFLSSQIFFIYLIYHFFLFLSPALYLFEYLNIKYTLQIISFVFSFSSIFITYYIIPLTWNFFLSFQNSTTICSFNLFFEAKLNEYVCFYIKFYYLCVFYCQFFVFLLLSLKYTNTNKKFIKKYRKLYHYCFIVFSTLISPPEVLSQICISLIFIFIFEFLLLFFFFKFV